MNSPHSPSLIDAANGTAGAADPAGAAEAAGAGDDAAWAGVRPRRIDPAQWQRFEAHLREIFTAFGLPPDAPGTGTTPRRFLSALFDATSGYDGDENLVTTFPDEGDGGAGCRLGQIVEGPIPFFSLCEHHALPFHGTAYVGYIAGEQILGLSKLTRLVRLFAQRFTVQERLGQQISEALEHILAPHGVAVHINAVHLCTQMRGVRELDSSTRTSTWRGAYAQDPHLRAEFFEHLHTPAGGGLARY